MRMVRYEIHISLKLVRPLRDPQRRLRGRLRHRRVDRGRLLQLPFDPSRTCAGTGRLLWTLLLLPGRPRVQPAADDVRRIQALYGVGTGTVYGTGLTAPPIWPPATSLPGWPPATTYWPAWPNYTRGTTYRPYYTTRRPYYTTRRPYFTTRRPYKRPKPDSNDNFISKMFHWLGDQFG